MNEDAGQEKELRAQALQFAFASSVTGEPCEAIITRAQAYLNFMKGTPDNG